MSNTKSTLTIDEIGNLIWHNEEGERHREDDKPAVIHADGSKAWYVNGKLHRDNDKPAIIDSDGTKEWWVNGEFIRSNDD